MSPRPTAIFTVLNGSILRPLPYHHEIVGRVRPLVMLLQVAVAVLLSIDAPPPACASAFHP